MALGTDRTLGRKLVKEFFAKDLRRDELCARCSGRLGHICMAGLAAPEVKRTEHRTVLRRLLTGENFVAIDGVHIVKACCLAGKTSRVETAAFVGLFDRLDHVFRLRAVPVAEVRIAKVVKIIGAAK